MKMISSWIFLLKPKKIETKSFFFVFFKKLLKRDKNHQTGSDVLLQRDLDWVDIKRIFCVWISYYEMKESVVGCLEQWR